MLRSFLRDAQETIHVDGRVYDSDAINIFRKYLKTYSAWLILSLRCKRRARHGKDKKSISVFATKFHANLLRKSYCKLPGSAGILACLVSGNDRLAEASRQGCLRSQEE